MKKWKAFICLSMLLLVSAGQGKTALAENIAAEYTCTQYGMESGLSSLEINAITQTQDGYIWAGSYSGLYRYDGIQFTSVLKDYDIRSVMALYCDSMGRLWIGTNDSGVACYEPETENITFYTTDDGLGANSIRSICEDEQKNMYIGTSGLLTKISVSGAIRTYDEYPEISCVKSIVATGQGQIAGVTNSGYLFFLKNDTIQSFFGVEEEEGVYYNSVTNGEDGRLILGTSANEVYVLDMEKYPEVHSWAKNVRLFGDTQKLMGHTCMQYSEQLEGYFVGADNGMGFLDKNGRFRLLEKEGMDNSICAVFSDYQGNIWFASNKQGIGKWSKNSFTDIFKQAGLEERVVNCVLEYHERYYFGCDDGLLIINQSNSKSVETKYIKRFENVRVRNLMEDSRGRIWASTYGLDGLVCINQDETVNTYNESMQEQRVEDSGFVWSCPTGRYLQPAARV